MKHHMFSAVVAAARRGMSRFQSGTQVAALLEASSSELQRARESEGRFKQVVDIAPVMIWMSGPDTLFTYLNKYWLDFTGRLLTAELGHGWREGLHEADRRQYESLYQDAFAHRQPFRTEFRLKRSDGVYRWILDCGSPIFDEAGAFAGYLGSCLDITDHKMTDQSVASLGGRLIEAQEQERSRLARELHDDINQRLALLAIELEQLRCDLPPARKELAQRIDNLQQTTLAISRDIESLSRDLHSPKLDFLGLVPAFASFCREFAQQHAVEVRFTSADVPSSVPRDVSLCLFRVLQEASHNALKHSGVRLFDVELRGFADQVYLAVRDAGGGFDPNAVAGSRGLGLVSMRERLNLIGGTLSIRSGPTRGTEIFAQAPLFRQRSMLRCAEGQSGVGGRP